MSIKLQTIDLDDDAILWRYMDIAKFISMLKQRAIWLARADTFADKHEGSFPDEMREYLNKVYKGFAKNNFRRVKDANDFQDYLVKNTFISCWHHNLEENMVMWKIYGKDKNMVAIQTTVKGIKNNVNTDGLHGHSLIFRNVDYKNANEISGQPRYEDCFFRKRRHYKFEEEVRISLDTYFPHNPTKNTPKGHKLPVSISKMVDKILVHPDCQDYFLDVVKSVTSEFKLDVPVKRGMYGDE